MSRDIHTSRVKEKRGQFVKQWRNVLNENNSFTMKTAIKKIVGEEDTYHQGIIMNKPTIYIHSLT